ncbi:MAG: hypothetical protein HDS44_04045 [Bacteroides sp.]|nr:hypothetical protein [Bacteroides sp.]
MPYCLYSAKINSLSRKGVIDKAGTRETFGLLDELSMDYSGNRLSSVSALTDALPFDGLTGVGLDKGSMAVGYDASGRLSSDVRRGIVSVSYDNDGHPVRTVFKDGNEQRDVWDGFGNHLATRYYNRAGASKEEPYLTKTYAGDGQIEITSGAALGSVVSYLSYTAFPGGYFNPDGPHYYITDHQGNHTAVVDSSPKITEENNYYPYGEPWRENNGIPFMFSGNERLLIDGLNDYDFHARRYNSAVPAFSSWDAFNEQYPWLSPYTYCAGNPICYIDPTGEEPTNYEAALMARAVYMDKGYQDIIDDLNELDWVISKHNSAIKYNHPAGTGIGVQSMLFQKTKEDGTTEYAYVYAGTNSWEDGVEDIMQIGGLSMEYSKAIKNARILDSELKEYELTFVGHSMGGGNAIAATMATGRSAITFNTAVVSIATMLFNGLSEHGKVVNYISASNSVLGYNVCLDPVSAIQNICGMRPPGIIIPVCTGYLPTHSIEDIVRALKPKK